MRKISKLQKKIQMSTNHQSKENVLNQITEIENNLKISINTERILRKMRAIAAIKNNPKYFYKFIKKKNQRSELELDLSSIKRGTRNQATKK